MTTKTFLLIYSVSEHQINLTNNLIRAGFTDQIIIESKPLHKKSFLPPGCLSISGDSLTSHEVVAMFYRIVGQMNTFSQMNKDSYLEKPIIILKALAVEIADLQGLGIAF